MSKAIITSRLKKIIAIDRNLKWEMGDAMNKIWQEYGHKKFVNFYRLYHISGKQALTLRAVSLFFPAELRATSCSWEFYAEIYFAIRNQPLSYKMQLRQAKQHLALAKDQGLSIGQFRKFLRSHYADPKFKLRPSSAIAGAGYSAVIGFRQFLQREWPNLGKWSSERAQLVLDDLGPLHDDFTAKLKQLASPTPH